LAHYLDIHPCPTRRSSDLSDHVEVRAGQEASSPLVRHGGRAVRMIAIIGDGIAPSGQISSIVNSDLAAPQSGHFQSSGTASQGVDRKSTRLNSSHVKISYA